MKPLKLGVGVIIVVIGAILMADAVVAVANGAHIFFSDVPPAFEFIVGVIAVVAATPQIEESRA